MAKRPVHRNEGKTATTHVKDTSGLWCVFDAGSQTIVREGARVMQGLTYEDARRAKDYAVTKLKVRKAAIRRHDEVSPTLLFADEDFVMSPDSVTTADSPPNPDPQLEAVRQSALAAARPVAKAAQAKHETKKQQRAPGWEPPPAGVTGARQAPKAPAKDAPVVRAPGFEAPSGGKKSTAPETTAAVEIDPIPDGDDNLEIDEANDEVTELVSGGGDLETEVKRTVDETESKVIEACKALKPGDVVYYYPDDAEQEYAAVAQVHAPTCLTLQLGVTEEMLELAEITKTVPDVPGEARPAGERTIVTLKTPPTGAVLKSVMLAPKEGKRANTWSPIL